MGSRKGVWPLERITRLCSVVDGHPQTANVPDGHLRLPRIDRFEVLKRLRAQNANQAVAHCCRLEFVGGVPRRVEVTGDCQHLGLGE